MSTNCMHLLLCISADRPNFPGNIPCPGVVYRSRIAVPVRQLCDGWSLCPDDSDEDPANCGGNYG